MHLSLKRTLFILSIAAIMVALLFTPALAAVNEIVWRESFSEMGVAPQRVATDRNGNVIVVGGIEGGPAFIRKFSGGGQELWNRQLNFPVIETITRDIAVDSDGYIYVVGETYEDSNPPRSFVSKYGPKGGHHWTRQFPKDPFAHISGVDVGPGGNVYVAGNAYGALPNMSRSSRPGDAFIRKYNPAGKIYWTRQFSLNNFESSTNAFDVAIGPGGGVYVAGIDHSESRANDGLFLRKFSPRGGVYWTRRVSRLKPYFAALSRIAVDRVGEVTIVGTSIFGGTFTVKYTHKGRQLWTRPWDSHMALDVTVDRERNIYIVGMGNDGKAFIRKYDSGGNRRWTRDFANGSASGAAADSANNVYVVGEVFKENSPCLLVKFRR